MILREMKYRYFEDGGSVSTAIQNLNSSIPPVPPVAVSLPATNTLTLASNIKIKDITVFNDETVNTMITQQTAINTSYSDAERLKKNIIPGRAGMTVQQAVIPGGVLKPGLEEFVSAKLQMGMKFEQAVNSSLITGNNGVRTVNDLINNTNAQVKQIEKSLSTAANTLSNRGIINGLESGTQIGGIVLAASVFGTNAINNLISNTKDALNTGLGSLKTDVTGLKDSISKIGTNISGDFSKAINNFPDTIKSGFNSTLNNSFQSLTNIKDSLVGKVSDIKNMISGGNFATGIADKLSSGIQGVTSGLQQLASGNLSGITSGLAGLGAAGLGSVFGAVAGLAGKFFGSKNETVEQMLQKRASANKAAYEAAVKSIGSLEPDKPNYLGGTASIDTTLTSEQKTLLEIERFNQKINSVQQELAEANRIYRTTGNQESLDNINQLETKLAKALQSQLKSANTTAVSILTDAKRGINAIPGGLAAFSPIVSNNSNTFNDIKNTADLIKSFSDRTMSKIDSFNNTTEKLKQITDPTKMIGNLAQNLQSKLSSIPAIGGILSIGSGAVGKLNSLLGSFGVKSGGLKTAVLAENTYPIRAQISSKTGQLLGDSRVPPPPTIASNTGLDSTLADEYVIEQRSAIKKIDVLTAKYQLQEIKIKELYLENQNNPTASNVTALANARNELANINRDIAKAQQQYDNIINT